LGEGLVYSGSLRARVLNPSQERHLCRAIGAVVEDLIALHGHRRLISGPFPDADGPGREPAAGQEAAEGLFAKALAIGRVEKGQIEGLTIACGLEPKVGAVAAVDTRDPNRPMASAFSRIAPLASGSVSTNRQ